MNRKCLCLFYIKKVIQKHMLTSCPPFIKLNIICEMRIKIFSDAKFVLSKSFMYENDIVTN